MEYDLNDDDNEAAMRRFTWRPYWQWQELQWSSNYDAVAGCSMLFMLLCNIASRYNPAPELSFARIRVRAVAVLAIFLVLFGLWLMRRDRAAYNRLRGWILLLQYCIVATMVYWVNIALPQGQSPNSLLSVLQIVYRNGNLLCVVLASTLRMPWHRMAMLNIGFVAWMVWAWVPVYCSHLVNSPDYPLQQNKHLAILNSAASGLDYLSGRGGFAGNGGGWQPTAHRLLLHCGLAGNNSSSSLAGSAASLQELDSSSLTGGFTGSLTSSECLVLLEGQCKAILSTFNAWWGLCFSNFLLVLAEHLSKWQWLHTHGAWMLAGAPALYQACSKAAFLRALLLRLHCVLDVALLLLWAGFSAAYVGSFDGN
uniref:Transmembrane protein n=1 Tax=Tetradesmus obliquus TaxID=3088 RepID=A0A383VHM7_TETOB|eukprot:jgi/Sobl393_1/11202/SZX65017.1